MDAPDGAVIGVPDKAEQRRMARQAQCHTAGSDSQNAGDPLYRPMGMDQMAAGAYRADKREILNHTK